MIDNCHALGLRQRGRETLGAGFLIAVRCRSVRAAAAGKTIEMEG